ALDAQLAGALVLDEDADILGLREQIEQRIDELLEQRLSGIARRGGVEDLRERVELALDEADGALVGNADQPTRDHRQAVGARAAVLAAPDERARSDIDDRH